MGMKDVRIAIVSRITTDPAGTGIMARLGGVAPFLGRLPKISKHGENFATVTIDGETTVTHGRQEDQTFNLHVFSYDHDLAQDVAENLRTLFHGQGRWVNLGVPVGQRAVCRVEFEGDVPDLDSELIHKIIRIRVKYGR